MFFAVEAGH
jgi:hypothetical protein